jgi:hypothetical protein
MRRDCEEQQENTPEAFPSVEEGVPRVWLAGSHILTPSLVVAIEAAFSPRLALFASLAPVCAVDVPVSHFCRGCGAEVTRSQLRLTVHFLWIDSTRPFILQCSNYLF